MSEGHQKQMSDLETQLVGMHAALTKKVDDGFHEINEKIDVINTALMGCLEDGTSGLVAKVESHSNAIAEMRQNKTIEKANACHDSIAGMRAFMVAAVLLFIGAVIVAVVSAIHFSK